MIPGLTKYTPRQQEAIDRAARDPVVTDLVAHVLEPAISVCTRRLEKLNLGRALNRAEASQLQGSIAFYQGLLESFNLSLKR